MELGACCGNHRPDCVDYTSAHKKPVMRENPSINIMVRDEFDCKHAENDCCAKGNQDKGLA